MAEFGAVRLWSPGSQAAVPGRMHHTPVRSRRRGGSRVVSSLQTPTPLRSTLGVGCFDRRRGRVEGGWKPGLAVFARPVQELETDAALAVYGRHLGDRGSAVAVIALPLFGAALVGRADETKRFRDLDGPVNTGVETGAADDRRCSCLCERARAPESSKALKTIRGSYRVLQQSETRVLNFGSDS
jgi:hypothetical protein